MTRRAQTFQIAKLLKPSPFGNSMKFRRNCTLIPFSHTPHWHRAFVTTLFWCLHLGESENCLEQWSPHEPAGTIQKLYKCSRSDRGTERICNASKNLPWTAFEAQEWTNSKQPRSSAERQSTHSEKSTSVRSMLVDAWLTFLKRTGAFSSPLAKINAVHVLFFTAIFNRYRFQSASSPLTWSISSRKWLVHFQSEPFTSTFWTRQVMHLDPRDP